ncbi:MAG: M28 family peptidase [Parvularculaceae bacterium]
MRAWGLSLFIACWLGACASQQSAVDDRPLAAAIENSTSARTAARRIEADVRYLADDARGGREAGTAGYDAAADYVAGRFKAMGLAPGARGDWFQPTPLRSAERDLEAARATLEYGNGDVRELRHLEDYLIGRSYSRDGFDVTGPVVFVGFGVSAPEEGHDDYAGLDVDGKIVAVLQGAPSAFASEKRAYYGSTDAKMKTAAAHGAIGFLSLYTEAGERRRPWKRTIAHPERAGMTWVRPDGRAEVPAPQLQASALMSPAGAALLFEGAPKSYDEARKAAAAEEGAPEGFELSVTMTLSGSAILQDLRSKNVVAILEGDDPELRNEAVIFSAHLDHIGLEKPETPNGDGVNNGALDNAMGVSAMLEVARKFVEEGGARRTLVFVAVTAEEKGLIGSDYFAHYPTVPKDSMVADINLDMPLVLFDFADVIAFGAEHSTLGRTVQSAADVLGVVVTPDPVPEMSLFTRSDHFRFVEQGVPSIFLFVGFGGGGKEVFDDFMKNHYHSPSDDISLPIDYGEAARFAELNYRIARNVANNDTAPQWLEGDFFGELFGDE